MPELPEVETIRRGLEKHLVGRRIEGVIARPNRLRKPSPMAWVALEGRRVESVTRHAKALRWHLDDGGRVSAHLGMTGKFLFSTPDDPVQAHTHLRLLLDDGQELRFVDPRRFGWFTVHAPGDDHDDTAHYGMDALDPTWTPALLAALLVRSKAPLKAFLLDQTKIAGLGNIYVCEALWRAGLSPRRLACNTPRRAVAPLLGHIVDVLEDSLAQGGTSFNDYVNSIGEPGKFLLDLAVFQKEGQPCGRCGAEIRRIVQLGRSSFYCGGCQR